MPSLLIRYFFLLMLSVCLLQGCANVSFTLRSNPALIKPDKKSDEKNYGLRGYTVVVSNDDLETLVHIDNDVVFDSYIETFYFIRTEDKRGARASNIGKKPFVITLGLRGKHGHNTLDISNAMLLLEAENKKIEPLAIYMADNDQELECLDYPQYNYEPDLPRKYWGLPLASAEIPIPEHIEKNADSNNPMNWKCLIYVFDVPTPEPSEHFSLLMGTVVDQRLNTTNDLRIYFSPRKFKYSYFTDLTDIILAGIIFRYVY